MKELSELILPIHELENIKIEAVEKALCKLKNSKAPGPSGVTGEMIKALGREGTRQSHFLFEKIWMEEVIPTEWKKSVLIPLYKIKGDLISCENFGSIKLIEIGLERLEKVVAKRLRETTSVNDMQFGFMLDKNTADAIFIARQL